ncbi:hypothetical protein [Ferruginibacter sp. HRS2-29]|uniref:hypothetical protein n=1 Tax=Ferruginibacter sp. HRS2-29 TaxID=2487334 RepID=UPI0020CD777D|nr:hypothetical protein [Ferruginibacter sp. HRS2-29]MCP9752943.1 hypothetical protein [Ferruginibacter sp. HRS2-29]
MRKIALATLLAISCISVAHSSATIFKNHNTINTADDKDFYKSLGKMMKKINGKKPGDIEIGTDYSFPAMDDFDSPYFNWRPTGYHFYEMSSKYRFNQESLLKEYDKYVDILTACKDLKVDKKKADDYSKTITLDYSKDVYVLLKADLYHTRLSLYVFRNGH